MNTTPLEAISAWLLTDKVRARKNLIEPASLHRMRHLARRQLTRAVAALGQLIYRAIEEEHDETVSTHPKLCLSNARRRDLNIRATRLLMQLAKFDPSVPAAGRAGV